LAEHGELQLCGARQQAHTADRRKRDHFQIPELELAARIQLVHGVHHLGGHTVRAIECLDPKFHYLTN
jgi:hypothetical protein